MRTAIMRLQEKTDNKRKQENNLVKNKNKNTILFYKKKQLVTIKIASDKTHKTHSN